MRELHTTSSHLGSGLILFVLAAVIALILLMGGLTMLLGKMMGSLIGAMVLMGCFFAIIAGLVYYFSLREAFRQLRQHLETVYQVAQAAQWGYEAVISFLQKKVFL